MRPRDRVRRESRLPGELFRALSESHTRSTREEAAAAAVKLHELGAHRVLLVTSLFHTRRAGALFRAAAPDLTFVVAAAPDQNFTPDGWWHNREARKIFLMEWLKTVAGWLKL